MNKYKIISIILSVISLALLEGMLYLVYGKESQEPKSNEVITTTTETTTEETTTKDSETQQAVPQVQVTTSFVAAPVAPPADVLQTTVILGKAYPLDDRGRISGDAQEELRAKYAELERQNEAKQPTGLGGANLDG